MLNIPNFKGVEFDHFRRQDSSKSMGMETKRQQKTINHKSCGQIFWLQNTKSTIHANYNTRSRTNNHGYLA